uniref:Uncharacterized protein n=1 Tax=Romanomermis culicivorax TaxID=13658 RepID=A0A915LC17_ROMCU
MHPTYYASPWRKSRHRDINKINIILNLQLSLFIGLRGCSDSA